ncbi:MAG: uroporphyrinogen decarboxylase [Actinomycetota bacterium]
MASKDLHNHSFLRACRCEPVEQTPVWFMRQAGRSLPEYRALRKEGSILNAIKKPEISTEITLQPIRRYGVDAAILFSDIVVPVHAIGFGIDIEPGVGPVAADPFRSSDDLNRLRDLNPEIDTPYVLETVKGCIQELQVPLIGFAGGPFTVASYLIEGGPSRSYQKTKALMFSDRKLWDSLMERLTDITVQSLLSQVEAGASAIQLFDSWAGSLSPSQYENFVFPYSKKVFDALGETGVPKIHFGVGTGELLSLMSDVGADVVGIDWRVPIDVARERIGFNKAVQGNLDPAILGGSWASIESETIAILDKIGGKPGHIFNLGHGVTPDVNPDVLLRVVELVHDFRIDT